MDYHIDDFTEAEYRRLLAKAVARWRIVTYAEGKADGRICLWRHDIDMSPHRGRRMASIEAECGVRATYFVLLHSPFYSMLEQEIRDVVREIAGYGHDIGLHFDAAFYGGRGLGQKVLEEALAFEKRILEQTMEVPVRAFSFHNPGQMTELPAYQEEEIAGMLNADGREIRERFGYCSDSNGYWRHRRLLDVLESGEDERLYVLTHPEWWVPQPLSPKERVARCIRGRAERQHQRYESVLARQGRLNVS